MRTFLVGLCVVGAGLGAAPGVMAAGPAKAGAVYDGQLRGGQQAYFRVAKDGGRLTDFALFAKTRCSNGKPLFQGITASNEKRPAIAADGSLSFQNTSPLRLRFGKGTSRIGWTGKFSPDGSRFDGLANLTWKGAKVSCSATAVPFTLRLDSKPGTPFKGRRLATGTFAAKGRGLTRLRGLVYGRAGVLRRVSFLTRPRCENGTTLRAPEGFTRLVFNDRGRLSYSDSLRARFRGGGTVRKRFTLRVRVFREGGRYRIRGSWRIDAPVFRNGRRVTTCKLNTRFAGTLVKAGA